MICGNEEAIINRCLESASSAFDELCLVRAIGERPPDSTVELARKFCQDNGKQFVFAEYKNKLGGLCHVDHFGDARQKSFELSSGDWQMWLDCDDYLDEINCARIREAVKTDEHDAIFCKYLVEKMGAEIMRERLIRRGFGSWRRAIHETCDVSGRVANCPQISVFHSDHSTKNKSSASRNATILKHVLSDAPRHFFYLHSELKMIGDVDGAKRSAHAALMLLPEDSVEERYLVLLNLAEMETENAERHLLSAAKIQPHRREAFAYLSQHSLNKKNISDATSWFRIMDSLPLPSPIPWTHRSLWLSLIHI